MMCNNIDSVIIVLQRSIIVMWYILWLLWYTNQTFKPQDTLKFEAFVGLYWHHIIVIILTLYIRNSLNYCKIAFRYGIILGLCDNGKCYISIMPIMQYKIISIMIVITIIIMIECHAYILGFCSCSI